MINNSLADPQARTASDVLAALNTSPHGLSLADAEFRLKQHGPNILPQARPPGLLQVFLHQFASPLIYVLLAAALVSLLIRK